MKTLNFLQILPKAELHLHIEGTLEPELMFQIAERNQLYFPYQTVQEIRQQYQFDNLLSFLNIYYLGTTVLLFEQDFYDLTFAYLTKAHSEGIKHVEIFFDPQAHTERGVSFEFVVNGICRALDDAKEQFKISSFLILSFLRHLSEEDAFKTLNKALPYKDKIKAVGLDSSEIGNPPEKFTKVFEAAIGYGFLTVAHAGEEGPSQNIINAIEFLKISRIDHGVNCLDNPALIEELVQKKIPLTVCPLSNVMLKVFPRLEDHNLKTLFDLGLKVTINSDDPAYFGGYLVENYSQCYKKLNFSLKEMAQLAKNSFEASFLSPVDIEYHCQEIDKLYENYKLVFSK